MNQTPTIRYTDWLMSLLTLQSNEVKLNIISRLADSLAQKAKKTDRSKNFFDGLNNSWVDDPPAEEVSRIREARSSGATRVLTDF